jgi:hypothetical protein
MAQTNNETSSSNSNSTTSNNNNTEDINNNDDDMTYDGPDWKDYTFLTFRFGIFIAIICFPCYRGLRIWYEAGGRILFRRSNDNINVNANANANNENENENENDNNNGVTTTGTTNRTTNSGYIIGLRYQPADMDRWLMLSGMVAYNNGNGGIGSNNNNGNGGDNNNGTPAYQSKLTNEEVYALPEIIYKSNEHDDDDGDNYGNNHDIDNRNNIGDNDAKAGNQIQIEMGNHDDNGGGGGGDNNPVIIINDDDNNDNDDVVIVTNNDNNNDDDDDDEEANNRNDTRNNRNRRRKIIHTTTTNTSCSICIDEFRDGETIRLLPLCGHAYHTECIHPWLTERQGCCPYCKSPVICNDIIEDDDDDDDAEDKERRERERQN